MLCCLFSSTGDSWLKVGPVKFCFKSLSLLHILPGKIIVKRTREKNKMPKLRRTEPIGSDNPAQTPKLSTCSSITIRIAKPITTPPKMAKTKKVSFKFLGPSDKPPSPCSTVILSSTQEFQMVWQELQVEDERLQHRDNFIKSVFSVSE